MTDSLAPWLDAYGKPYDPRPALNAWRGGEPRDSASELWERLHHQGSVNTASYATVPELARIISDLPVPDWNAYALIASIEEARHSEGNPPLPTLLADAYHAALVDVLTPALRDYFTATDDILIRSIFAVLAHAKGQRTLATIALWTEDERREAIDPDIFDDR